VCFGQNKQMDLIWVRYHSTIWFDCSNTPKIDCVKQKGWNRANSGTENWIYYIRFPLASTIIAELILWSYIALVVAYDILPSLVWRRLYTHVWHACLTFYDVLLRNDDARRVSLDFGPTQQGSGDDLGPTAGPCRVQRWLGAYSLQRCRMIAWRELLVTYANYVLTDGLLLDS